MNDFSYFQSDALDDVHGIDPWAPTPPTVAPIAPGFIRVFADTNVVSISDPQFLALVGAADLFLRVGTSVRSFMRGVAQTAPYQAVPGARNALRHTLHQTGVL